MASQDRSKVLVSHLPVGAPAPPLMIFPRRRSSRDRTEMDGWMDAFHSLKLIAKANLTCTSLNVHHFTFINKSHHVHAANKGIKQLSYDRFNSFRIISTLHNCCIPQMPLAVSLSVYQHHASRVMVPIERPDRSQPRTQIANDKYKRSKTDQAEASGQANAVYTRMCSFVETQSP